MYTVKRTGGVKTRESRAINLSKVIHVMTTLCTLQRLSRVSRSVAQISFALAVSFCDITPIFADPKEPPAQQQASNEALAKKTQNPVSDLISVPLQNNFDFGVGPEDKMVWMMNIQPVVPFRISEDWNIISRTILPVMNVPSLAPGLDSAAGIGDLNPTFFLSPANPSGFIWGVGPTMTLPTATDSLLGDGEWSAGPAGVGLFMEGPWVVGALAHQQWSFAGWGDRAVNQFLTQTFINYNFPTGWYITSSPIITGNFEIQKGNQWTVPLGVGVGKVHKYFGLPININLAPYYNVVTPDDGASWQVRFTLAMLFPE